MRIVDIDACQPRSIVLLLDEVQSLRARVNALETPEGEQSGDVLDRVGREALSEDEEPAATDPPSGKC